MEAALKQVNAAIEQEHTGMSQEDIDCLMRDNLTMKEDFDNQMARMEKEYRKVLKEREEQIRTLQERQMTDSEHMEQTLADEQRHNQRKQLQQALQDKKGTRNCF